MCGQKLEESLHFAESFAIDAIFVGLEGLPK